MTYLGSHPGGKGWIFMRGPNNDIFSAAQAIFDESIFPKCPKSLVREPNTRLQSPAPKPQKCAGENCHCPLPFEDEIESYPEHPVPQEARGKPPNPLGEKFPARDGDGKLVMRYPLVPRSFQSLRLPSNARNSSAHKSHAGPEGFPNL